MTVNEFPPGLVLNGLDGSNPLGFLATLGVAVIVQGVFPELRLRWEQTEGRWRPFLVGCGDDEQKFSHELLDALKRASMTVFDIDKKMPFDVEKFSRKLQAVQSHSSTGNRRDADFLSNFGTELYPDEKNGQFQDSKFRMVRSGDSAGQGLPFYAKQMRKEVNIDRIQRTLFHAWDYQDTGYSLRWDPIEDQRYALRWRDPSKSSQGTMLAANSLAVEALQCFPTLLVGMQAQTTGFHRVDRRKTYFVWPIWTPPVTVRTLRSLLALNDLHKTPLPRSSLAKIGIEEVYRSERIRQNQYYSNFAPAQPAI